MNPKYIAISLLNEQYTKLSMTAIYNKINYVNLVWAKNLFLCITEITSDCYDCLSTTRLLYIQVRNSVIVKNTFKYTTYLSCLLVLYQTSKECIYQIKWLGKAFPLIKDKVWNCFRLRCLASLWNKSWWTFVSIILKCVTHRSWPEIDSLKGNEILSPIVKRTTADGLHKTSQKELYGLAKKILLHLLRTSLMSPYLPLYNYIITIAVFRISPALKATQAIHLPHWIHINTSSTSSVINTFSGIKTTAL